ncbi:MFS transporter [Sphaerochaeta sp. PS]|uniref:MFS transporter n=1 Tax=Sphaerochaeta sp. PS TaxID=3076336 RepID=UPI0028A45216|nr:MFS transporter [Sphaerochaeta sp. PS]MDT4762356.1 MFS transporter [Sphaerochaeta sp. PS]
MQIKTLLFAMIAVTAIGSNLFGGLSAEIQSACSLSISQLSALMSLSQVGTLLSFLLLPILVRRMGPYLLMVVGILGSAVGLLGMGMSRSALAFTLFFLVQAWLGYFYGTNSFSVMVLSDPQHKRTNIPLMHLVWSVASVFAGFYISLIKANRWYLGFYQMSALYLGMSILFALYIPKARAVPHLFGSEGMESSFVQSFSLLRQKRFLSFFFYLIFFSAVEYCCTVYPLLFLQQNRGATPVQVGLSLSLFFAGSTVSRFLVIPLANRANTSLPLLKVLTTLGIASTALLVMGNTLAIGLVAMVLLGFSFGALNPACQLLEVHTWPKDMVQIANMHSVSAVIGRLTLPALIALISIRSGLDGALVVLSFTMVLALAFLFLFARMQPSSC